MTKKMKLRMIVIMPTLGVTVILGGLIYLALQSAMADSTTYLEKVPSGMEMEHRADAGKASCNFDYLLGQNVDDAYLNLGRPVRVINPGDAVTEDFNPERVNVYLDTQGYVKKVTCG